MPKKEERNPITVLKCFFSDLFNSDQWGKYNNLIISIDPGAEGAIGLMYGQNNVEVLDIPNLKVARGKGKKTVFNLPHICAIFEQIKFQFSEWMGVGINCIIEQPPVSMGKGKGSAYGQGRLMAAHAMWPLFFTSLGFKIEEVAPSTWKKKMKLSSDKETCRHKALGLFPKAPLQLVKHHNRAEALLLAEYYRRTTACF